MRAALSTADLRALADCSREVLSALDCPTTEEWARRVIERAMPLLRADRIFIVLPAEQGFSLHFSDVEMLTTAAAYQAHFHVSDVWTTARRRELGLRVYTHEMLLRRGEERTEFWNDYILAHRLYQPAGLSCDVDGSPVPASLIGYKGAPGGRHFGDREIQLLNALHPAFTAAVKVLRRFGAAGRELASTMDRLPIPVLLIGAGGIVHANIAFSRTLGSVADSIMRLLMPTVAKLLRAENHSLGRNAGGVIAGPDGQSIPWSLALLSSVAASPLALVHFQVAPRARITDETRERLGLTQRQAVVAELMAEGRTYREIATALGIQPNTARRHWEQVLQRLGIHSRHQVRNRLCGASA